MLRFKRCIICYLGIIGSLFLLLVNTVLAETLTVQGIGQDLFYVYNTDGKQLDYERTNTVVELFPGTYTVSLNGSTQTVAVQAGQKIALAAGTVTATGIGQDLFYVYNTDGKQLDYERTNNVVELFPGTYTVSLNSSTQTAAVQAGQKTALAAGTVTATGIGQDLFYVYNTDGKQLDYERTNNVVELFPGTYTVSLNGSTQTAAVQAGQKTALIAGIIKITGNGQDLFYVYNTAGKQLDYERTNGVVEIFPGIYSVKLNNTSQTYTVQAGASQPADPPVTTNSDFESGKTAGVQQCMSNPASCGISVTNGGDFESGKQAGIQQCKDNPLSCGLQEIKICQSACIGTVDFESGKQAGIQQCVSNPTSCGINVTAENGCNNNSAHAAYNSSTGEVYIPFIDVPGAFGVIQTYEVYLIQQPLTFTFDLDNNRIKLK